jgi:hypothetical protein
MLTSEAESDLVFQCVEQPGAQKAVAEGPEGSWTYQCGGYSVHLTVLGSYLHRTSWMLSKAVQKLFCLVQSLGNRRVKNTTDGKAKALRKIAKLRWGDVHCLSSVSSRKQKYIVTRYKVACLRLYISKT